MTRDEFKSIEVGDTLHHRYRDYTVVAIEYGYDNSVRPSTKYAWSVHCEPTANIRIDDRDVRDVELIKKS